jgi:cysteinyl-tRNA synthetase
MVLDQAINKIMNTNLTDIHHHSLTHFLEMVKDLLGIDLIGTTPDISDEAKRLIMQRRQARANSDWITSDEIRNQLAKINIDVRDSNADIIWSYKN